MWAPVKRAAPSPPVPVAVNTSRRNMPLARLQPLRARAGPESLRRSALLQSSWPLMWAPVRADRADGSRCRCGGPAGGGERVPQVHVLIDLQAVGGQGGAGVVAQVGSVTAEAAADVGAGQVDRAVVGVAGNSCPAPGPACCR